MHPLGIVGHAEGATGRCALPIAMTVFLES
jgi:hypothetical protein